MTKHFYIFRHGLTDYNAEGRIQGQGCDIPLNQTGREQAKNLASELADIDIDIIFTSPLKRAYETAKAVADNKNILLIENSELKECSYGTAEGKLREEITPEILQEYKNISPHFKFENGETQIDAANRAFKVLKHIAENTGYNNIGISTHGGIIRCLLSYIFNTPTPMGIKNAKPYHIVYENNEFKILPN